ncbi:hypothetical protein K457DRAFT_19815 [Linnemannia elongata AG-77]|uniref:Uncharacterized protein n=1 Tax=Linnemannia elongata AG-77 TaxID=1314771 RepID=A0A197JX89_9FUNG|nr:hypothetical protein K457DRAFT_19815 [Linnemannia elongata AG-77]
MAVSRTWILKGSLWIQAVFLLVLTSILADTNAWIGAILTGVGLVFVVIGIIAAHKRRIGYLYFYATLIGLWQILALTHILIICGLIALPLNKIDPAFIVGQKIVENPSSPFKIAIPVLYGLQWSAWCAILVCMVSLRLETIDPTLGFEIQDPKHQRHSLDTRSNHASSSYPNINGSSNSSSNGNNQRMNQHLFNFRQSVIAPIGGASSPASSNSRSSGSGGAGIDGHSVTRMYKGKDTLDKGRYGSDIDTPQAPERSWVGMERRASSDSNAIFIPNDPRISQVVVTFKDDDQDTQQEHTSRSMLASAPSSKQQIPEATTIYITNHHYGQSSNTGGSKAVVRDGQPGSSQSAAAAAAAPRGLEAAASRSDAYVLNFSASGESLSEMIFKSTQDQIALPMAPLPTAKPVMTASPPSTGPVPLPSQLPPTATKEVAESHPSIDDGTSNPARIRGTGTKVSLTLSSDSSSSELSALSNASSSDSDDMLEFVPINTTTGTKIEPQQEGRSLPPHHGPEGVVAGLAMTSVDPLHIIPKNQAQQRTAAASESKSLGDPEMESQQYTSSHGPPGGDEYSPQAQPNSSDSSHSLSSLSSTSTRSRNDDRSERGQVFGTTDTKPVLTSSSSPASSQQPASTSTSAQAPSPFNYTPAPFTPFPAGTESVSVTPTTATATSSSSAAAGVSRAKSHRVSLPLQYWRNRTSQPTSLPPSSSSSHSSHSSHSTNNFSPSSNSPVSPPQSFTQNYLTNPFISKKKKFQIPTIIIHADDEDGEPPRVLSPQDIEYLTTMPPVPLRPLIQPWDEIQEDEDGVYDDGYDDYDDYPHPHHQEPLHYQQQHQQYQQQQFPVASGAMSYDDEDLDVDDDENEEYNEREEELMGMRSRIDEAHQQRILLQQQQQQHQLRRQSQKQDLHNVRAMQFDLSKYGGRGGGDIELEDDPYALDVPVDLRIDRADLEGLERR